MPQAHQEFSTFHTHVTSIVGGMGPGTHLQVQPQPGCIHFPKEVGPIKGQTYHFSDIEIDSASPSRSGSPLGFRCACSSLPLSEFVVMHRTMHTLLAEVRSLVASPVCKLRGVAFAWLLTGCY